jgi:hypothetical protein
MIMSANGNSSTKHDSTRVFIDNRLVSSMKYDQYYRSFVISFRTIDVTRHIQQVSFHVSSDQRKKRTRIIIDSVLISSIDTLTSH